MEESDAVPLCSRKRNKGEGRKRKILKIGAVVLVAALLMILFCIQHGNKDIINKDSLSKTKGDTALTPGDRLNLCDEVKFEQVIKEMQTEREAIPFNTVRVNDPYLDRGIVRVIEEGSEGVKEHLIEIVKKDGQEISRKVVSSEVVQPAADRVLEYGGNSTFSRGDRIYQFKKVLYVTATAYCPGTPGSGCPIDERGASQCTGFNNDGYTSTGVRAVAGDGSLENPHIIAVDPAVIPLKSLVYLEGYGFARAEDTGGVINGNSIDLLFDLHSDACMFGRKQLKVYLLEE
jgi:resuscitation-promoting factor RpfB